MNLYNVSTHMVPTYEVLKRRDLANFIELRAATPGDDLRVGELLIETFVSTNKKKLPHLETSDLRIQELRNVRTRRRNGVVYVLELGFQIVGTFSLIHPDSELNEAWIENSANLRCVAIDPRFHGCKLSQIILNQADLIAKEWKVDRTCLHVQDGAIGVSKLYEAHGYRRDQKGDFLHLGQWVLGHQMSYTYPSGQ
jgi:hypothetical protein